MSDEDRQADAADDERSVPVQATTETLLTGFPELTEEMAETVADTVDTIPGLLAQTPNDLLTDDAIERTIVTRLTETISWQTSAPIGEQNTPDIDLSAEDIEAVDTDEDDSDGDGDGNGDVGGDDDDAASAENSSVDDETVGDTSGNEEDTSAGDDQDLNEDEDSDIGSCSVWNPTRIGYSVAGANGAQIYRECESLGNFDVFLQSDSGDLYQVAAGVDKTEADRTMNRLAASIAPVDIERGVEEFGPKLEDIEGASLVETPDALDGHGSGEENSSEAPVDEPEADGSPDEETAGPTEAEDEDGDEGELPHEMPASLGSFDLDRVDVDDDANLTDYCYSNASDIPGVDEIVVTIRLLNGTWEVYVGPDGETHPRGTFETKENAVAQARTIATETIGSTHAAERPSESDREIGPDTGENEESASSGDNEVSPDDEAEADADAEFSGEDVKTAFDVHGPPAFALADAFERQDDLVATVENEG